MLNEDLKTDIIRKFKVQIDDGEKKTKKTYMGYFSAINPGNDIKERLS